jgi:hypothetical protein
MAAKEHPSRHVAHLDRFDVKRTADGNFLLPVVLEEEGQRVDLKMAPDDAARLHAQLDRALCTGWATGEQAMADRNSGETYPVSGSGHLRRRSIT